MVITSMISKLVTLAIASSVMHGMVEATDGPPLPPTPHEIPDGTVLFYSEQNCLGSQLPYTPPVLSPSAECQPRCIDLNNNSQSVFIKDQNHTTICIFSEQAGCKGTFSTQARDSATTAPFFTCTNAMSMGITMGSAWCYMGPC